MRSEDLVDLAEHNSTDLYSRVKLRNSNGSKMTNLITSAKRKSALGFIKNRKGGSERSMASLNLPFHSASDESTRIEVLGLARKGRSKEFRLEVGDLVWWEFEKNLQWPGEILHEARALPHVLRAKKKGHLLVSFYGDDTYRWLKPDDLLPFDQYYKQSVVSDFLKAVAEAEVKSGASLGNSSSMQNIKENFPVAVREAEAEVKRRASLGLTCCCRNSKNFRHTKSHGVIIEVDVQGLGTGEYTVEQINKAREAFLPSKTLSFIQELALTPRSELQVSLGVMVDAAEVLAYRRAVFEEFDPTFVEAFVSLADEEVTGEVLGESKSAMEKICRDREEKNDYSSKESKGMNKKRVQQPSKIGDRVSQTRALPVVMKPVLSRDQRTNKSSLGSSATEATPMGKRVLTDNSAKPRNRFHRSMHLVDDISRECRVKVSRNVVGSSNVSHHSAPVKVSSRHPPESGKSVKRLVEETGESLGKPVVKQVRTDYSASQMRDPPVVMKPKLPPSQRNSTPPLRTSVESLRNPYPSSPLKVVGKQVSNDGSVSRTKCQRSDHSAGVISTESRVEVSRTLLGNSVVNHQLHPVARNSTKSLVGETGNSTGKPGASMPKESLVVSSIKLNPCLEEPPNRLKTVNNIPMETSPRKSMVGNVSSGGSSNYPQRPLSPYMLQILEKCEAIKMEYVNERRVRNESSSTAASNGPDISVPFLNLLRKFGEAVGAERGKSSHREQ